MPIEGCSESKYTYTQPAVSIPQVACPVEEWRSAEHDRQSEENRQAEVELQVVSHILQHAVWQQGGDVTFFMLAAWGLTIHFASVRFFVLLRRLKGEWCLNVADSNSKKGSSWNILSDTEILPDSACDSVTFLSSVALAPGHAVLQKDKEKRA